MMPSETPDNATVVTCLFPSTSHIEPKTLSKQSGAVAHREHYFTTVIFGFTRIMFIPAPRALMRLIVLGRDVPLESTNCGAPLTSITESIPSCSATVSGIGKHFHIVFMMIGARKGA